MNQQTISGSADLTHSVTQVFISRITENSPPIVEKQVSQAELFLNGQNSRHLKSSQTASTDCFRCECKLSSFMNRVQIFYEEQHRTVVA